MISCNFYLNNRIKTITGKNIMSCWKTFNTDFGEAVTEIVKVKVIDADDKGRLRLSMKALLDDKSKNQENEKASPTEVNQPAKP